MITMRKSLLFLSVLLFSVVLLDGCYYDVESELYPGNINCNPDDFTFSGRVLPIVEQYCLPCHSQAQGSGGIVLEGFTNIRNSAVAGSLLCAIQHTAGCSPMPKNSAKLSDCDINAIQAWVDAGAPEN
jgi:hypothetical protein